MKCSVKIYLTVSYIMSFTFRLCWFYMLLCQKSQRNILAKRPRDRGGDKQDKKIRNSLGVRPVIAMSMPKVTPNYDAAARIASALTAGPASGIESICQLLDKQRSRAWGFAVTDLGKLGLPFHVTRRPFGSMGGRDLILLVQAQYRAGLLKNSLDGIGQSHIEIRLQARILAWIQAVEEATGLWNQGDVAKMDGVLRSVGDEISSYRRLAQLAGDLAEKDRDVGKAFLAGLRFFSQFAKKIKTPSPFLKLLTIAMVSLASGLTFYHQSSMEG